MSGSREKHLSRLSKHLAAMAWRPRPDKITNFSAICIPSTYHSPAVVEEISLQGGCYFATIRERPLLCVCNKFIYPWIRVYRVF